MPFLSTPPLLPQGIHGFVLGATMVVRGSRGDVWSIPAGFRTDLASVPAPLRWLVDSWGAYTLAAILHDWLCHLAARTEQARREVAYLRGWGAEVPQDLLDRAAGITRAEADGVFRMALRWQGTSALRRAMMWGAVRVHGGLRDLTCREAAHLLALVPLAVVALAVSLPALVVRVAVGLAERIPGLD